MEEVHRVGPKRRHVSIPDGWFRVVSGVCESGDRFARTDSGRFEFVDPDDVGMEWDSFDLLIRRKSNH